MEYLDEQVSQCDVLLALVGKRWLGVQKITCSVCGALITPVDLALKDDDNSSYLRCPLCGTSVLKDDVPFRLHDENDFVRIEITSALNQEITVVPVLVEGAEMPSKEMLPPELESFSRRQAAQVRTGRDFRRDVDDLIKALDSMGRETKAAAKAKAAAEAKTGAWVSVTNDPNNVKIEAAIRWQIGKPEGEITKADLEKVTILRLYNNQLRDVKGLEKLTYLTDLHLSNNQLTDVKGLEKHTQLRRLWLSDNQLWDVKGLEKLAQLKLLDLRYSPNLTEAQIDQLQKALPKCRIENKK